MKDGRKAELGLAVHVVKSWLRSWFRLSMPPSPFLFCIRQPFRFVQVFLYSIFKSLLLLLFLGCFHERWPEKNKTRLL